MKISNFLFFVVIGVIFFSCGSKKTEPQNEPESEWLEGCIKGIATNPIASSGITVNEFFILSNGEQYAISKSDSLKKSGRKIGSLELYMMDCIPCKLKGEILESEILATEINYLSLEPSPEVLEIIENGNAYRGIIFGVVGSKRRSGFSHTLLLSEGNKNYELFIPNEAILEGPKGTRASIFQGLGHYVYEVIGIKTKEEYGEILKAGSIKYIREASEKDKKSIIGGYSGKYSTPPKKL